MTRITDLPEAASIDGTEYLEASKLSSTTTITATTISAQASDNSFNDSANGFGIFAVGERVNVTGFSSAASNLFVGTATVQSASKLTIGGADGDVIVDEAAGNSVTISKWESRRVEASVLTGIEEGTFSGTVEDAASGGNVSATSTSGTYSRVGNWIHYRIFASNIDLTGLTAGNDIHFGGLPYTTIANRVGSIAANKITYGANTTLNSWTNGDTIKIVETIGGNNTDFIVVGDLVSATSDVFINITTELDV